jgi:TP901 family phage tail tape measure protein
VDFLPPVFATLFADTGEYNAKMDEAGAKMEAFGAESKTTGEMVTGMWMKLSTVVLAASAVVIGAGVDLAYKYDDALQLMQQTTDLTAGQMDYLRGQILNVSTASATSADLITTGMTQLIKAGISEKESLIDVGQAAKFAQATGGDLNDTLTSAIGIQRMHIAGTTGITNTLNIMDVAIKHSQLTADLLNQSLGGKALSAFSAYHIDLKTAITLLAGFADQNLVGTKATMALKTGIQALEKPAYSTTGTISESALAIKSVGLNYQTLADDVRKPGGMLSVLQQLSFAFDHSASSAMKAQGIAAFMQDIFGASAGPAFTNILSELPKLLTLYDQMSSSGGAVNSSFATWLKSPAGAFQQFKTVLENSLIKLGDVVLPKLTVGIIDATKLITGIEGSSDKSSALEIGVAALIGGSIATKLVQTILTVMKSIGIGGEVVTGASAGEIAATSAGIGGITAAGVLAFMGTLTLLRHNFLGLGTAVDDLAGIMGFAFDKLNYGTTGGLAGHTKSELKKHGLSNVALGTTGGLTPAVMRYIDGKDKDTKHTVNVKVTVK